MAQGTANPGKVYGAGQVRFRAVGAGIAGAAAAGLAALLIAGPSGILSGDDATATVTPVAEITQVDDFVTRRYLSNPVSADDSWKDDHITRRYLPGS